MNKPKPLEKPMTNAELADEIERQIFWEDDIDNEDTFARGVHLDREQWQQIIAALRRQPEPVVHDFGEFEGRPLLGISAPDERQSSDKVLVPREPSDAMLQAAKPAFATIDAWCAEMQLARGRVPDWPLDNPPLKQAWRLMLSAAEGHHE